MKSFKSYYYIPLDFTGICKTLDYNAIFYYKNGKPHREDGPAIIEQCGDKYWYLNGEFHRESGPAKEYFYGDYKDWFYKNKMYGRDNSFINETWIAFVLQLKRKEKLRIFK